jgi:hypothetical protein
MLTGLVLLALLLLAVYAANNTDILPVGSRTWDFGLLQPKVDITPTLVRVRVFGSTRHAYHVTAVHRFDVVEDGLTRALALEVDGESVRVAVPDNRGMTAAYVKEMNEYLFLLRARANSTD